MTIKTGSVPSQEATRVISFFHIFSCFFRQVIITSKSEHNGYCYKFPLKQMLRNAFFEKYNIKNTQKFTLKTIKIRHANQIMKQFDKVAFSHYTLR